MVPYVPHVAEDESSVAGFVDERHSARLRVFSPAEIADDMFVSCGELAGRAGYVLHPGSTWREISDRIGPEESSKYHPASGGCDELGLETLLHILTGALPDLRTSTEVTFAMWPGYAGEVENVESVRVFDFTAPLPFGRFGGLAVAQAPLDWLLTFGSDRPGRPHMPIYVWPPDGAFLISCPIYSNSLFISADEELAWKLEESALDVVRVDSHSPLNCRDDLD